MYIRNKQSEFFARIICSCNNLNDVKMISNLFLVFLDNFGWVEEQAAIFNVDFQFDNSIRENTYKNLLIIIRI